MVLGVLIGFRTAIPVSAEWTARIAVFFLALFNLMFFVAAPRIAAAKAEGGVVRSPYGEVWAAISERPVVTVLCAIQLSWRRTIARLIAHAFSNDRQRLCKRTVRSREHQDPVVCRVHHDVLCGPGMAPWCYRSMANAQVGVVADALPERSCVSSHYCSSDTHPSPASYRRCFSCFSGRSHYIVASIYTETVPRAWAAAERSSRSLDL
jgi:hypothetical protein